MTGPSPRPPDDVVRVRDPQALRALAHPLRLRLIGLLRVEGPSTATRLGQRLGESSGATSYHLRELARYGFVEELEGRGTGRERWWQARHRTTSWEAEDFADEGSEVVDELNRQLVALRGQALHAWLEQQAELDPAWDGAAELSDWGLRLTPDEARRLSRELGAVLDRWTAEHADRGSAESTEHVRVHLDVLPLRRWPL
jgi:DNA-binding transcriptional ArsR family regulator